MKYFIALVLAVVVTGGIVGGYYYPQDIQSLGSSVTGSTFNTAKVAAIAWAPATSAASSTSILNTDANTRYITDSFVQCTGTNGQGFTMTAATTSVANQGLQGSTNYAANDVATTTVASQTMFNASSTEGVPTYTNRLWPSATYLTFDASAVNTGACIAGVHYLGT